MRITLIRDEILEQNSKRLTGNFFCKVRITSLHLSIHYVTLNVLFICKVIYPLRDGEWTFP